MYGQAKHTVDVIHSLGLEQCEEVERRAGGVVLVKARLIIYQLSGQLGRAIIEILCAIQHFISAACLGSEGACLALTQVLPRRCEGQRS
jgi:hypothetical protein